MQTEHPPGPQSLTETVCCWRMTNTPSRVFGHCFCTKSLCSCVDLRLQAHLIWTSHTLSAQWPHMAGGHYGDNTKLDVVPQA